MFHRGYYPYDSKPRLIVTLSVVPPDAEDSYFYYLPLTTQRETKVNYLAKRTWDQDLLIDFESNRQNGIRFDSYLICCDAERLFMPGLKGTLRDDGLTYVARVIKPYREAIFQRYVEWDLNPQKIQRVIQAAFPDLWETE